MDRIVDRIVDCQCVYNILCDFVAARLYEYLHPEGGGGGDSGMLVVSLACTRINSNNKRKTLLSSLIFPFCNSISGSLSSPGLLAGATLLKQRLVLELIPFLVLYLL